jgi:hypothetical protein
LYIVEVEIWDKSSSKKIGQHRIYLRTVEKEAEEIELEPFVEPPQPEVTP